MRNRQTIKTKGTLRPRRKKPRIFDGRPKIKQRESENDFRILSETSIYRNKYDKDDNDDSIVRNTRTYSPSKGDGFLVVNMLRIRIIVILFAISGMSTADSDEDSSDSSPRDNFVPSSKKQAASSKYLSQFEESGVNKDTEDQSVTRRFQPSDGKGLGSNSQQATNHNSEKVLTTATVNNGLLNPKKGDLGKSNSNSVNLKVDENRNDFTSNTRNTLPHHKLHIHSVGKDVTKHLPASTTNINELGKAPLILTEGLNTPKHTDLIVEANKYNFATDKTAVKVKDMSNNFAKVDLGNNIAKTGNLNIIMIKSYLNENENSHNNLSEKQKRPNQRRNRKPESESPKLSLGDVSYKSSITNFEPTDNLLIAEQNKPKSKQNLDVENSKYNKKDINLKEGGNYNNNKSELKNGKSDNRNKKTKIRKTSDNNEIHYKSMKRMLSKNEKMKEIGSVKSMGKQEKNANGIKWTGERIVDILTNYTGNNKYSIMILPNHKDNTNVLSQKRYDKSSKQHTNDKVTSTKDKTFFSMSNFKNNAKGISDSNTYSAPEQNPNLKSSQISSQTIVYSPSENRRHIWRFNKGKTGTFNVDNWLWILPKSKIIEKVDEGQDNLTEAKLELNNKSKDEKMFRDQIEKRHNITKMDRNTIQEQNRLTVKGKHTRPGQVLNEFSFSNHQKAISGIKLGNTAVQKYNRDLNANRPAPEASLTKSQKDNRDFRPFKNNQQGIVKFNDNPLANVNYTPNKIANKATYVNHFSDTIRNSNHKTAETKVRKNSDRDKNGLTANNDINVNSLASLEKFLSSNIGLHAKTKNNLWNFPKITIQQRAKQPENQQSHFSPPSSQFYFVNPDWKKQATKNSYNITVPSTTPKTNLTILPQFGSVKINVGGFSHGLPASLSKLHQKLQEAWSKRKRTYVPETKINYAALDREGSGIGSKRVAITTQSTIMLDIPGIKVKERNGSKQKPHHQFKISTILPYLVRSDTSRTDKGKTESTIKNNDIQTQNGINVEKSYPFQTHQIKSVSPSFSHIKNNMIEIVNEARESLEPKTVYTQSKLQNQNSKITTILPYLVRSSTKNANSAKAINEAMTDFTVVADSTKLLSNLPKNNILIRSNLNFRRFVEPRVPTKRTNIVRPHANVVVRNNLGPRTKKNLMRNRNIRQNQVSMVPQNIQMNPNSASTLSINRGRNRRVETKTVSQGILSPLQLKRMQQAMSVMRAPGPMQTSVNRVNNFQRQAKQIIPQRPARSRNTVTSNTRTRTRQLRRNNVISNSMSRIGRRIQFRNPNRNFRLFPTRNVRNPATRGFV
ncbi:unnamed protein product [Mytilus coruscus]|uniref:Uncharacterized protein n=1 Tax=Mytilus coruscus TaxID=42192 RepID=A0A6J7ZT26_MYTCO|nr:unnamed protein product [Mytilus coruscus]